MKKMLNPIIITITTVGVGMQWYFEKKKNERKLLLSIIVIILTITSITGAWAQWHSEQSKNEENDTLTTKNLELLQKIDSLQEETINTVTGSKSFPLVVIDIHKRKHSSNFYVEFIVTNQGKYPLKNIVFSMIDRFGKADSIDSQDDDRLYKQSDKDKIEIQIGDVTPGNGRPFYQTKILKNLPEMNYQFSMRWENGAYYAIINGHISEDKMYYVPTSISIKSNSHPEINAVILGRKQ